MDEHPTEWTKGSAPVAVVMISLNEAHNIQEVLDNLTGWAQEVFVLDSFSTDDTVEIARARGVHVAQRRFDGFGSQWNAALELPITAPWTMKLDPDERLSDKLKVELSSAMAAGRSTGLSLHRRLWFMGRPLPITQEITRVWKTGACRFTDVAVNEYPVVDGPVVHVDGYMEHLDSPDLGHWLDKQNRYSTSEAEIKFHVRPLADKPRLFGTKMQRWMWLKANVDKIPARFTLIFLYYFLFKGLWRAGFVGYVWSRLPSPNIWKLAPGEALVIADGAIRRRWTWYNPVHLAPRHVQRPVDEAARQLADTLRQSVQRQLVADVPVGAFLSGGLDSSAIVAFARETVPDIACFTIDTSGGTEAGTADDLPYARRVARHLGVPLHDVRIDPDRMAQDMQAMIAQLEEPVADPACLNTFYLSRLARDNGITVLLSGAGGDDLFTGYRRHHALMMDKYLMALPRPARTLMQATLRRMGTGSSLLRRLNKLADGITLSASDRLLNYFAWTGRTDLIEILAPQTSQQVAIDKLNAPMRAHLDQMPDSADPMDRMLALEQRFFLAEHNLIYTDKMSMAASVEVRVPFLDPDLAAFAASLPTPVKQKSKEGKWIFKKAMEPYLPHDVIYRPKTGFGAPLRSWLTGDLRAVMDDLLSEETINRRGLFDAAALHRLRHDTEQARKDGSYTLFSAMCIELWARQFIDGQPGPLLSQH